MVTTRICYSTTVTKLVTTVTKIVTTVNSVCPLKNGIESCPVAFVIVTRRKWLMMLMLMDDDMAMEVQTNFVHSQNFTMLNHR